MLIENGADVNVVSNKNFNSLMLTLLYGNQSEATEVFIVLKSRCLKIEFYFA